MSLLARGTFKQARKTVRRNRGRSFLTMLGIIIGVASVIIIVGIGEGVKRQVATQVTHVGQNLLTIRAGQQTTGTANSLGLLSGLRLSGTLTDKDLSSTRRVATNATVVPLAVVSGSVSADHGLYRGGPVIATTQDLPAIINQTMVYGTSFSPNDTEANGAVLGAEAAKKLFDAKVPLGQTFKFRGQDVIVRGVLTQFSTAPLATDVNFNNAIFISYAYGQQLTDNSIMPYEILVKPTDSKQVSNTMRTISGALLKNHGDSSDFTIQRASQAEATTNSVLNLLTELIAGAAAISLFVGGIGIMNVTLLSVTERMHEIGIRKAVGATNRQILQEFMAESIVLSVWGGIIGILVACFVLVALRLATSLTPVIQWQIVLLATGLSIAIGVVFGSVPALKAARKDPIAALRNE